MCADSQQHYITLTISLTGQFQMIRGSIFLTRNWTAIESCSCSGRQLKRVVFVHAFMKSIPGSLFGSIRRKSTRYHRPHATVLLQMEGYESGRSQLIPPVDLI
ncbi:MAG: hypothetical protein DME91_07910 [Verrucomicrobia bacterium]|nr:MAG: hypothetical protein DME91_07910 [Verrucomicrobiota bacterium]